jgi:hypothetical protein
MLGSLGLLGRHVGRTMTFTQTNTQKRRRWIAVGIAILGGLVAAVGFFWVTAVAAAFQDELAPSPWLGVSDGPGLATFIVGSVILLGALITIRLRVHPQLDVHFIWAFVWVAWVAIALACFGLELNTDVESGIGEAMVGSSFLVGFLALAMLICGLFLKARLTGHDDRQ